MNQLFELTNIGMRYGSTEILQSINLSFGRGEFVAIAGPNGAGKSTLLSIIAGLSMPSSGTCFFLGQATQKWNRRTFARRVAVVLQTGHSAFPFTAEDIVYMGRMPHHSGLYRSSEDRQATEKAMEATETIPFRHREFRTLSDGEKQRVLLASALAQTPEVLLLDEPSAHLDLHHQVALYKLLRDLSRQGLLVIAVTHDLNVAGVQADRLILLQNGRMRAHGKPAEVIMPQIISSVFQVHVEIHHTSSEQPWMSYGE
jgi:ABC-type cobalamin/Fe3+-siderophores transport system ATPase subunit